MPLAKWLIVWASLPAVCAVGASAQEKQTKDDKAAQATVIPVWPKDAPGSEGWTQKEAEFSFDKDKRKTGATSSAPL
jgi:hypothetical protein